MRTFVSHMLKCRSGNVAVILGLSLPVLIGATGLGVEAGYWFYEQRRLQAAADLAAYAGAVEARAGQGAEAIQLGARVEAEQHGFQPAAGTIIVNWPPTIGPNQHLRAVEVLLQQEYPRTFSAIFISDPVEMNVRAVAVYDAPGPACILALDPWESQALWFTGSANAEFTGCDLMSNSLADDAVVIQGSVSVRTSCVNSAGGVVVEATLVLERCPGVRQNLLPADDPYASLPEPPDLGPCLSVPGGSGPKVLSPGKYCDGFSLSGDVTLLPGTYTVSGGTMRINGNSTVTGEGVTFYLTNGASLHMNGNAQVDLSAPSVGTYGGILFYGDRNSSGGDAILNGTADSRLTGSIYFPRERIRMHGDFRGSGGCTRLVGRTVEVRGNPRFSTACNAPGLSSPVVPGAVLLVE